MKRLVSLLAFCTLVGCKNDRANEGAKEQAAGPTAAPSPAPPPEPAKPKELTAKEAKIAGLLALQAFVNAASAAKIELTGSVIYNEETDPNHLLGRPGQYSAKMNWTVAGGDATLEVFPTLEGAKARKDYVEGITKSSPALLQYIYVNEALKAVLRLPKELTPTKAEEWNTRFQGLKL